MPRSRIIIRPTDEQITAGALSQEPEIRIGLAGHGGYVYLNISDQAFSNWDIDQLIKKLRQTKMNMAKRIKRIAKQRALSREQTISRLRSQLTTPNPVAEPLAAMLPNGAHLGAELSAALSSQAIAVSQDSW